MSYINLHWLAYSFHLMNDLLESYGGNLKNAVLTSRMPLWLPIVKYSFSGNLTTYLKSHGPHYWINLVSFLLVYMYKTLKIWWIKGLYLNLLTKILMENLTKSNKWPAITLELLKVFCPLSNLSILSGVCTPV